MIQTLRSYMQLATGLIESTSERARVSVSADKPGCRGRQQGRKCGLRAGTGDRRRLDRAGPDQSGADGWSHPHRGGTCRRADGVRARGTRAAVRHHVERLERELNQRGDQASAAANLAVSTAAAAVPAATKAAGQAAALATDTAVRASKVAAGAARSAASQTSPRATASGTDQASAPAQSTGGGRPRQEGHREESSRQESAGERAPVNKPAAKKAPARKTSATKAKDNS